VLVGCDAHQSALPPLQISADPGLPSGWVRYSYGGLSVGAPKTWTVSKPIVANANCEASLNDSVTADSFDAERASSCPETTLDALPDAVELKCLSGNASHLYAEATSSAAITGTKLRHFGAGTDLGVYLQNRTTEAVVRAESSPQQPELAAQILSTVKVTGRPC
jgi:hypothetical protein